ncbi:MAG: ribbon-helix-helix domain-containing protein [Candidatus Rokubacteria bacterium]|nr:ribbon-helix-helix domain-containing protein [Candidatus Rokubacteria bacterium]
MAEMVRKQVYIEPRQEQLLKALARELRVTEAELVRQGIDRGLAGLGELRPDPAAWKEAERYILRLMRKGPLKGRRRWTREELYGR